MPNQYTNIQLRKPILPVGPSIAYIELTQNQFARIDSDDLPLVGKYNWFSAWEKTGKHYYACRCAYYSPGKRKTISMHSTILGLSGRRITADHIDRDTLNNQRYNLRPASNSTQRINQRIDSTNTSGVKGVYWRKSHQKWVSYLSINGKRLFLGAFVDFSKAVDARKHAEITHHRKAA